MKRKKYEKLKAKGVAWRLAKVWLKLAPLTERLDDLGYEWQVNRLLECENLIEHVIDSINEKKKANTN